MRRTFFVLMAISSLLGISSNVMAAPVNAYFQTNLTSDLGIAANIDGNLLNPWGIAFAPAGPFWIADNHAGVSTLYNGAGQPFPAGSPLVVTIPPPAGGMPPAAPTGIVFNGTADFGGSHFLFATEDGTIAAWTSGTTAALPIDNSASGAVYKGLALANNGTGNLLYAANFNSGKVDVFNGTFVPVTVAGGFNDPAIPSGFAPFNIENIGGKLYVTYAKQNAAKHDDVAGAGNGFIDVFDPNGNFLRRLASQGPLNSPWGLALATPAFGAFSNDLLVGNFGNGVVNAFDPLTGNLLGVLSDSQGNPIVNQGLWGLTFGNGAFGSDPNALYFTAGIPGPGKIEDHGLFGRIQSIPEPGTIGLGGFCLGLIGLFKNRARRALRD